MLTSLRLWLRRCPRPPKLGTDDYERIKVGHFGEIVLVPTFGGEWLARWPMMSRKEYFATEELARETAARVAVERLHEAISDVRKQCS